MATIKKRPANVVRSVFRITRNVLAVLGVCFVYLLVLGYTQYQDRATAGDVACTFTRCV
ncbi:hypothetical protein [Paraburkholderia sediminicola]|uniref:hypothetical protein n=1 Tax=Paraburkholderia sediminicola TaxID=458836 RepID=UPI0038BB0ED0